MKLISFTYCKANSKDMITKKSGCLSITPFHYCDSPENEKILNYQNVGPWQVFDAHWYKCLSLDSLKNSKHRESLDPMEYISSFYTRLQWLFKIAHTKLLPKFTICVAVCANYANCSHWSPLGSRGSVIWISSLPGSSSCISMILSWHWPSDQWPLESLQNKLSLHLKVHEEYLGSEVLWSEFSSQPPRTALPWGKLCPLESPWGEVFETRLLYGKRVECLINKSLL